MTAPAQQRQHPADVQPPPQDSDVIRDLTAALLVGASVAFTAAAVVRLLRAYGVAVTVPAVELALRIVDHDGRRRTGTTILPRTRGSSDIGRAQRVTEAYYRAAYVLAASLRLTTALTTPGTTVGDAVRGERRFYRQHEKARRSRMVAAAAVARAADVYGNLLGWYAVGDDRATPECAAADGHNFRTDRPPLIGWPGMPHGGTCRCRSGPPFANNRSVDQVTARFLTSLARRIG